MQRKSARFIVIFAIIVVGWGSLAGSQYTEEGSPSAAPDNIPRGQLSSPPETAPGDSSPRMASPRAGAVSEGADYSREMRDAIHSFDAGHDSEAMDRFMDILVHGSPAERTTANTYLNLITQRMNAPSASDWSKAPIVGGVKEPAKAGGRHGKTSLPQAPSADTGGRDMPAGRQGAGVRENQAVPERGIEEENARVSIEPEKVHPVAAESETGDRNSHESGAPSRTSARTAVPGAVPGAMASDKRAQMKREIEAQIRARTKFYLGRLGKIGSIRILMGESDNPRAVGLPTGLLFSGGVSFTKASADILRDLAGLVYSLGSAQVVILPEGALAGDARILDMRRGMGVSSYFYSAGIAPPRVRVNLVQSPADVPRAFSGFRGIVVLFAYNQPLALTAEHVVGEEEGPPASLGVFPESFRADRGESVVLEFSIVEPPAGLRAWKYQLLQPGNRGTGDLAPLQEVAGASAQFHQIFWNGRKSYFGEIFPPGRYEAVLSATDAKDRTRVLRRWIVLETAASPAPAVPGATAGKGRTSLPAALGGYTPPGVPGAQNIAAPSSKPIYSGKVLTGSPSAGRQGSNAKKALKSRQRPKKIKSLKPKSAADSGAGVKKNSGGSAMRAKSSPSAGGSDGTRTGYKPISEGAVTYKIAFQAGTQNITSEGERQLSYVADAMTFYPQENLNLIGYADANEPDAAALAQNRAKQVASMLAGKYGIDAHRIQTQSKISESAKPEVAIYSYVNQ